MYFWYVEYLFCKAIVGQNHHRQGRYEFVVSISFCLHILLEVVCRLCFSDEESKGIEKMKHLPKTTQPGSGRIGAQEVWLFRLRLFKLTSGLICICQENANMIMRIFYLVSILVLTFKQVTSFLFEIPAYRFT